MRKRISAAVLAWSVIVSYLLARDQPGTETPHVAWIANWIWQPGTDGTPQSIQAQPSGLRVSGRVGTGSQNLYFYFRKEFRLSAESGRASAHVSADSRYKLYINGKYVGRGPARSDPLWQSYDTYDISRFLKPGQNVIAVIHHFYGVSTGKYILGRGGLLFQSEISDGNETAVVKTDETWKVQRAWAWNQDAPLINAAIGFADLYDARKEPVGWMQAGFDDSDWDNTVIVGGSRSGSSQLPVPPWQSMTPRDIPFLFEEERFPARVLEFGEVENYRHPSLAEPVSIAQQMAYERPGPPISVKFLNPDAMLQSDGVNTTIHGPIKKHAARTDTFAYMVVDFGRIVTGYPRITISKGVPGTIVDIGISEGFPNGRVAPTKMGAHVYRYIMKAGTQSFETTEWSGFRYMQLTFRELTQPVEIDSISVNFTTYPVEHRGKFRSSDELLNKIWEAGAYTVQLCMHDAYEDCPSREQRQWIDDSKIESLVNYVVFGDTKLIRRLLRQVTQSQDADGLTMAFYPAAENGMLRFPNNETDTCLLWIQQIRDYYLYSGDTALVRELYPAVLRLIGWFEQYIDEYGLLNNIPEWVFIDWAILDKRGEIAAINGLFAGALLGAIELARIVGNEADARKLEEIYQGVKKGINDRMWDTKRGIYVDCNYRNTPSRRVSQQTNGVLLCYDLVPPDRRKAVISYITDESRLVLTSADFGSFKGWDGPFDEERNVVMTQPYFGHFVLRGLAQAGAFDKALSMIRENWGSMIRQGADTIWEIWSPKESQVHGWSATPSYDLSTEVLGVRPTKPGFIEFLVQPTPVDLAFAEGVYPTVKGDIPISWKNQPESFLLDLVVPKGTTAVAAVPRLGRSAPQAVTVNSAVVWRDGQFRRASTGVSEAVLDGGHIRVRLEKEGKYQVEARWGK